MAERPRKTNIFSANDQNVQTAKAMNRFYEEIDELYRGVIKRSKLSCSASMLSMSKMGAVSST